MIASKSETPISNDTSDGTANSSSSNVEAAIETVHPSEGAAALLLLLVDATDVDVTGLSNSVSVSVLVVRASNSVLWVDDG